MKKYLLLGAGFSHNWHGLLSHEVSDQLISAPEVSGDDYLRRVVVRHQAAGSGFEQALSEVQADFSKDSSQRGKSLVGIQTAIARIFDRMNRSYAQNPDGIEFQQYKHFMLRTFMVEFDAIFTLNQDLLLEQHYLQHVSLASDRRRWDGPQLPGLKLTRPEQTILAPHWAVGDLVPSDTYTFHGRLQPFIKLHGSSNWRDANGGTLMIVGGEKLRAIGSSNLLSRYFELFCNSLCGEPTQLCIIGYGFGDRHINDVLLQAADRQGMKFFLIDTAGIELCRRVNPTATRPIYVPGPVDLIFDKGLGGVSKRLLSDTFGGKDLVSFEQVTEFFGLARRRA